LNAVAAPVVIVEGWDVSLFESVAEAESYLEPVDVSDGVYFGFDAEGRLSRIETDGVRVRIRTAEKEPIHVEELEDLLRGFLERVEKLVGSDCDLRCPVAACAVYTMREPESFRAVLALFFEDLLRTLIGQRLRR
jgi:hypothetical protein